MLELTSLHENFGVEILDVDLARLDAILHFPEIRAAFEELSLSSSISSYIDEPRPMR